MKHNPIAWFEIYVQDMPRAKAFYEAVFQVTLEHLSNPELELWAFPMHLEKMGASGALVKMAGKDSGVGGTLVYFSCQDCAIEAARINPFGGSLQRDKFAIGEYGFIALALDTEGNMFGLHSRV